MRDDFTVTSYCPHTQIEFTAYADDVIAHGEFRVQLAYLTTEQLVRLDLG